jgi:hypothetical protein
MATTKRPLDREIRFRAGKVDERRLAALAKAYELTESGVMRRLIADGFRALESQRAVGLAPAAVAEGKE